MHTDWTDYFITAGDVVKDRLLKNVDISKDNLKTIYYPIESPILPLKLKTSPIVPSSTNFFAYLTLSKNL